jgi:hypothetical protein
VVNFRNFAGQFVAACLKFYLKRSLHMRTNFVGVLILFFASVAVAQVTGSGTPGYIPLWKTTTSQSNSALFQLGGKVGLGTKTPAAKLDVDGGSVQQEALTVSSSYAGGTAFTLTNSGTAASGSVSTGIFAETSSTTGFGNGVVGWTNGTTGSSGVSGTALSTTSDAVFGLVGFAVSGSGGTGALASGQATGLLASTRSCTGSGCATPGTAGIFVTGSGGTVLVGQTDSGSGGVNVFRVDDTGKGYFDGGTQTGGADFAESVAVVQEKARHEPGDVLVVNTAGTRQLMLSYEPYSTLVAGIYSTKPGVLATTHGMNEATSAEVPLAIVGIVPCKVTTENGPIQPGDLLVTSSTPGYAMKGTDRSRMLGAVVGKAMEGLREGNGTIQVLVTLQ